MSSRLFRSTSIRNRCSQFTENGTDQRGFFLSCSTPFTVPKVSLLEDRLIHVEAMLQTNEGQNKNLKEEREEAPNMTKQPENELASASETHFPNHQDRSIDDILRMVDFERDASSLFDRSPIERSQVVCFHL